MTRMPSGANTRAMIPWRSSTSAAAAVCIAGRQPDEVALRLRQLPALGDQPGAQPRRGAR